MKKILLSLMVVLIAGAISAQNTFKYEIKADGGITIGLNKTKLDSVPVSGSVIKFYHGATELRPAPATHTQAQSTITGLADSLIVNRVAGTSGTSGLKFKYIITND